MRPLRWLQSRVAGDGADDDGGLRRRLYGLTACALLLLGLLVGLVLWQYRTGIVADARGRSATLAYLLAEQTTRTFQAVDLTLNGLEPVYAAQALPDHAPAFEQLLRRRVSELDFIRAIAVTDAEGRITQSSGPVSGQAVTLADQPYFQMARRDPTLAVLIGRVLAARPGLDGAIPVVRRLDGADGRFAGIMMASIEPKYFRDFYRNLDLGPHASIDLYQGNGSMLLASTGDGLDRVRASGAGAPSFDLSAELGQFRSPPSERRAQFVAYHRAQGYPLVVAVGVDVSDLHARWWGVALPILGAGSIAAVLIVAFAVLLDRRLAERRRARRRAATVQKLEALGQMTASVAHDFRNLLAVMQSTLLLVRRHGPKETLLKAAEEAIERGSGLITQLLAFSKRHEMQVRPADLNALVESLGAVLRHAAGAGVEVAFALGAGLPPCRADQTQFDAALLNLVVNARQAMPEGGTVTILTRPHGMAGVVALEVRDEGTGIAPGDLKRVFEPFFTTKAEGGTGLGLAQVYGFMRRIGGDVTVESGLGKGTTFTLLFPVAEADMAEARGARHAAPIA